MSDSDAELLAAQRGVHGALAAYLDENEIAVSWVVVIDVAGQGDIRYLAHRAGGGAGGTDSPTAWAALGMLTCAQALAQEQLTSSTYDPDDEPPGEEEET